MKKILLASTMLVGTAGAAAAGEITFSGAASTGIAFNLTTSTFLPEVTALFTAGMMTTTDAGLEAGASVTVLGSGLWVQKDPTDNEFGGYDYPGAFGLNGAASVYLSGSWGKVTVAYNTNADGSNATPGDADVKVSYSNTFGNFTVDAFGKLVPPGSAATTNGDLGLKGTYAFGDYTVYAAVERDASDADGNTIDIKAGATAKLGGFSAGVNGKFDIGTGFSWDVMAGYATGPYSISATVDSNFAITAKAAYDLGGGVSINAGFARATATSGAAAAGNLVYAGVSMGF